MQADIILAVTLTTGCLLAWAHYLFIDANRSNSHSTGRNKNPVYFGTVQSFGKFESRDFSPLFHLPYPKSSLSCNFPSILKLGGRTHTVLSADINRVGESLWLKSITDKIRCRPLTCNKEPDIKTADLLRYG
jgi:hypothetical protein